MANHQAEERNQLPLNYRGDVGKSTEKPGLEKKHLGLQLDPAPEPAAVGAGCNSSQGSGSCAPTSGSVQASKLGVQGKGSAWEGTRTLSRLGTQRDVFGGVPQPYVGAQEGEGLWAGGLCQALKQGGHPTTGFGFFSPYFLQSHPWLGLHTLPALNSGPAIPLCQAAAQRL